MIDLNKEVPSPGSTIQFTEDQQIALDSTDSVVLVNSAPGSGKEQPVSTIVKTPSGNKTIGSLITGNYVIGKNGYPTQVTGVFPQGVKDVYQLTFRDKTTVKCGLKHLWQIDTGRSGWKRGPRVVTTEWLLNNKILLKGNTGKYRVPLCSPVEYVNKSLPIDPYLLGALLGDGCLTGRSIAFSYHVNDSSNLDRVRGLLPQGNNIGNYRGTSKNGRQVAIGSNGNKINNPLRSAIEGLGLSVKSSKRFIPKIYLLGSVQQRLELLRGLMDTDGSASNNRVSFSTKAPGLRDGIAELVRSLGMVAIDRRSKTRPDEFDINIKSNTFCPFYLKRKADQWNPNQKNPPSKSIVKVEKLNYQEEQVCITVAAPDKLYLTEHFTVTHNSAMLLEYAHRAASKGLSVLYLAYNKAIVEDIRPKMPRSAQVATFHSFGLGLIRSSNGGQEFDVDFLKYNKIRGELRMKAEALNLCQYHFALDGNQTEAGWRKTCDRFCISPKYIERAHKIYSLGVNNKKAVSAFDMINEPVINNYRSRHYDLVLVDEVQDCGADKLALLMQIDTDRLVLVGDENQMINSYCGSDPFMYSRLAEMYSPATFSINQSFRVPDLILQDARQYVPDVWSDIKGGSASSVDIELFDVSSLPEDSLTVCRANAPLFQLASKLIQRRMDFSIKPESIKTVQRELKYLYENHQTLPKMKHAVHKRKMDEIARYIAEGWNDKAVEARFETIETILYSSNSLTEISDYMTNLISHADSYSGRRLTSIHTSKGLENENVFFLEPGISDSIASQTKKGWQEREEWNLKFVAITRSRRNLTYLVSEPKKKRRM